MSKKIFFILIFIFSLPGFSRAEENAICPVRSKSPKATAAPLVRTSNAVYLTLAEVTELALRNNFDIQLAQFDAQFKKTDLDDATSIYDTIVEAEAKYKDDQTKTASTLAGTRSLTHNYNLGVSKKLPTGTTLEVDFDNERSWTNSPYVSVNPAYDSSVKLTLKQDLGKNFFGIKDRSDVRITKVDIENAQYTSWDKIEGTLASVQKTYWEIAQYLKVVGIKEDMLLRARELFEINKEKRSRGIIEAPQLLASEANLRQREIDLILAQNELEFYKNKLKLLLNLEDKAIVILPKESLGQAASKLQLSEALRAAFDHRRDYLSAKNEVDSKRIKLVMKKNNLWPEVNLEASVTRNGLGDQFSQAIEEIFSEDNPEYFLGLEIKFPLENRKAKSEFDKVKIERAKALLNLKKIERQILVEIKDSVRDCNILEARLKKQKNVVGLQQEKLQAELKHYKYGRSDTDTVIRYQDDLLSSELLYTQALLDYKEALIELSLKENSLLDRFWNDRL